jgi:hypothetical protein
MKYTSKKDRTIKKSKTLKKAGAVIQNEKTPTTQILYNSIPIKCEICQLTQFAIIDGSIERSKTFGFFLGDNETTRHPVRLYRCINCNNCKVIYNGLAVEKNQKIKPEN